MPFKLYFYILYHSNNPVLHHIRPRSVWNLLLGTARPWKMYVHLIASSLQQNETYALLHHVPIDIKPPLPYQIYHLTCSRWNLCSKWWDFAADCALTNVTAAIYRIYNCFNCFYCWKNSNVVHLTVSIWTLLELVFFDRQRRTVTGSQKPIKSHSRFKRTHFSHRESFLRTFSYCLRPQFPYFPQRVQS